MRARLTEAFVDALEPADRDLYVFDTQLATFAYRLTPAGKGIFVVGKRPRRTVGHRPMRVADARDKAARMLADVKAGVDPELAERDRAATRKAGGMLVTELAEKWMVEYVRPKLKARTIADYEGLLGRYILPALGRLAVPVVTVEDINKMNVGAGRAPRRANYALRTVSGIFRFAVLHRLRPDNPAHGIRPYRERMRERFLSEAEIAKAAEAISAAESTGVIGPWAAAGLRLCLLTGCRQGEILATTWADVNFAQQLIRLPDSKNNAPRTIHLSDAAIEVLRSIPRREPYVIAGADPGQPLKNLSRSWIVARKFGGLDDVRLHDLRHSFASLALRRGVSLPMIGKLLGHKHVATTARYAHLARDAAAAVTDEIGTAMTTAIEKGSAPVSADVVKLRRRRAR